VAKTRKSGGAIQQGCHINEYTVYFILISNLFTDPAIRVTRGGTVDDGVVLFRVDTSFRRNTQPFVNHVVRSDTAFKEVNVNMPPERDVFLFLLCPIPIVVHLASLLPNASKHKHGRRQRSPDAFAAADKREIHSAAERERERDRRERERER
jgi:hypothetical protein